MHRVPAGAGKNIKNVVDDKVKIINAGLCFNETPNLFFVAQGFSPAKGLFNERSGGAKALHYIKYFRVTLGKAVREK